MQHLSVIDEEQITVNNNKMRVAMGVNAISLSRTRNILSRTQKNLSKFVFFFKKEIKITIDFDQANAA